MVLPELFGKRRQGYPERGWAEKRLWKGWIWRGFRKANWIKHFYHFQYLFTPTNNLAKCQIKTPTIYHENLPIDNLDPFVWWWPFHAADKNRSLKQLRSLLTPEESMAEAMKEASKAIENANLEQPVELVNFRSWKELLPQELAGYSLENASRRLPSWIHENSNAKGKYRNSAKKTWLWDHGYRRFWMGAMATWSAVTIDREDDMGYERTGSIGGYKAWKIPQRWI